MTHDFLDEDIKGIEEDPDGDTIEIEFLDGITSIILSKDDVLYLVKLLLEGTQTKNG